MILWYEWYSLMMMVQTLAILNIRFFLPFCQYRHIIGVDHKKWLLYFKRSYVQRHDGEFKGYKRYLSNGNILPMTYTIVEAYVKTAFSMMRERDLEIVCTLRGSSADPTRTRWDLETSSQLWNHRHQHDYLCTTFFFFSSSVPSSSFLTAYQTMCTILYVTLTWRLFLFYSLLFPPPLLSVRDWVEQYSKARGIKNYVAGQVHLFYCIVRQIIIHSHIYFQINCFLSIYTHTWMEVIGDNL